MKHRLLVVDDEAGVREALKQVLEFDGHEVRTANSGAQAVMLYPDVRPQVVFLDVKMAGLDGLDTLSQLLEVDPSAVVVMISGHANIATAIEATRRGAFDFLEKPLDSDRLLVTLRNALGRAKLATSYQRLRQESDARYQMVGESAPLRQVREIITRVAPTTGRVLISGENGSGKELVARAIHEGSPRSGQPFVEVNCAAIPSELIESELFGHMKGSFTGAVTDRAGKFEQADGGTLFLDEIGDMALSAQAKVLRALQEGVITRIGGARAIQVDVRVIAATNKNLELEIREGRFREDLFYRLNVVPIHVPALRERRGDIPILVAYFVKQLAGGAGAAGRNFDPEAVAALAARPWPGNVRELRNAVERLLILAPGRRISAAAVARLLAEYQAGPVLEAAAFALPFVEFMEQAEKLYVEARLKENDGKIAETARAVDIPRSSLYKKMERFGLIKADE